MRYIRTKSKFAFTRLHNYKNVGQDIEQSIRYNRTGVLYKADNIPCTKQGDLRDCQIKTSAAQICKGIDIEQHIKQDKAMRYIYGSLSGIAYVITKEQYLTFATLFSRTTTTGKGNNKSVVTRLKDENKAMIQWLEAAVAL